MPNLGSTRFLTELALSRGVPLHYVSSNRVTLLSGDIALPPGSVSAFPPPKTGSDGFTASKWASERYLENVAEVTGLDVCTHRPCALTGAQAPSEDALNAILRFSVLMKAVPQFPNVRGFFDFEKVGGVAANIVKKALQSVQVTRDHATSLASLTHHSSGVKVPVDKIQERMQDLYGGVFGRLALAEWVQRARTLGIGPW
ncbi:hybrid NRPS/PKS enzyme [Aspergillus nomiae NRRL 13137]|uniref:Hybrid NRPS/PKS enzyme n=1 Tax=Aspergillus nomiae NRRL (strain ATCC 15546 / NRRL 13137 / CBS 260.88 / M93) TaxID=1509407 RepID=A0A0L1J6K0_ASPN3|nr:hybrid NRPS/PKS enzyme [Aspergillus nomiae NRRL 13137]KNG87028.1 hybrid NRPS/PKS enzyme [Aspergillus nomiae NRRL 13137]